jgi:hypothetical protein
VTYVAAGVIVVVLLRSRPLPDETWTKSRRSPFLLRNFLDSDYHLMVLGFTDWFEIRCDCRGAFVVWTAPRRDPDEVEVFPVLTA